MLCAAVVIACSDSTASDVVAEQFVSSSPSPSSTSNPPTKQAAAPQSTEELAFSEQVTSASSSPAQQSSAEPELLPPATWQHVFDRATPSEQVCMHRSLGPFLGTFLGRHVMQDEEIGDREARLFACLAADNARSVFVSASTASFQRVFGSALDPSAEDCWRQQMADADVLGAFAFEVTGVEPDRAPPSSFQKAVLSGGRPGFGQRTLFTGLVDCAPELVLTALLNRLSVTEASLSQAELNCLSDRLGSVNVVAVIDPRQKHVPGWLEAGDPIGKCATRLYVEKLFEQVGEEPIALEAAGLNCVAELLSEADLSNLAAVRLGYWQLSSMLWFWLWECWPDQFIAEPGDLPEDNYLFGRRDPAVNLGEPTEQVLEGIPDWDRYEFAGEEGTRYSIEVRIQNQVPFFAIVYLEDSGSRDLAHASVVEDDGYSVHQMALRAPETGRYRIHVGGYSYGPSPYTLSVDETDIADDHSDTLSEATLAAVGEVIDGELEFVHDTDAFAFDAVAGATYLIETILVTLSSSNLQLEDSEGETLSRVDKDGDPGNARIVWTAPTSGRYLVKLSGSVRGTYSFAIWRPADDHSGTLAGATTLTNGVTTAGEINFFGDRDAFEFDAEEGVFYDIVVSLGTLLDSYLVVSLEDGVHATRNDDYGDSLASRVVWQAEESRSYYIRVSGRGTGTYDVTVTPIEVNDDQDPRTDGPTVLRFGESVNGTIDYPGDSDAFEFVGEAGVTYNIVVRLGTLPSFSLEVSTDPECPPEVICTSSGSWYEGSRSGQARAGIAVWTPDLSGKQTIVVYGQGEGTYELTVTVADNQHFPLK